MPEILSSLFLVIVLTLLILLSGIVGWWLLRRRKGLTRPQWLSLWRKQPPNSVEGPNLTSKSSAIIKHSSSDLSLNAPTESSRDLQQPVLRQQVKKQSLLQSRKASISVENIDTEQSSRIALLTEGFKNQQQTIRQYELEQQKLRKTVVAIHKKYLLSQNETKELHRKVNSSLESASIGKDNTEPHQQPTSQSPSDIADQLSKVIADFNLQARDYQQLKQDYERINYKFGQSTAREKELESSLSKSSNLKQELTQAKCELAALREYEQSSQRLKTELSGSEKQLDLQRSKNEQLKDRIEDLEKDIQRLTTTHLENQENQNQLETLLKDKAASDVKTEELQVELTTAEESLKNLQMSYESQQSDNDTKYKKQKEEISSLVSNLEATTKRNEFLTENLKQAEAARTEIKTLRDNNSTLNASLDKTVHENQALLKNQQSIESRLHELTEINVQLSNQQNTQIRSLTSELHTSTQKCDSFKLELKELETVRAELVTTKSENSVLHEKLDNSILEHKALVAKQQSLENKLAEITELATTSQQSGRQYKEQTEALKAELHTSTRKNELLAADLKKLDLIQTELESSKSECSVLLGKLSDTTSENQTLISNQQALESSLSELTDRNLQLNQGAEHHNRALEDALSKVDETEALNSKLRSAEGANQRLLQRLERLEKDNESIPGLQASHNESEARLKEATVQIGDLQTELQNIQRLEEALGVQEHDINTLQKQHALALDQANTYKKELDTIKTSLAESNASLSEYKKESQQLNQELDNQLSLQNEVAEKSILVQQLQQQISTLQELPTEISQIEGRLKAANTEIVDLKAQLNDKASLEETLQQREYDLNDLLKQQTQIEKHTLEYEHARVSLAQSTAALSKCKTESKRLSAKLKSQQRLQDELKEQDKLISDLRQRSSSFDALKLELTVSKESHEQLRKITPDLEELQKRLKKIERHNRKLLNECSSIPKMEQQLARVRAKHKELKATHKDCSLQLELITKENTSNKRRATRLYRQVNPSSGTIAHKKLVRKEIKKTLSAKKSTTKKPAPKRPAHKPSPLAGNGKIAKKKHATGKAAARKSPKRTSTQPRGRKTRHSAASDNLKKIYGIGPVFEKILHKNGITRYKQLAKLDRHGVKALSLKFGPYSHRITKDAWVKSAAKLAKRDR